MASAKKSTSNRVKPVSSAAKVRMADAKATKAAAAKAPRYPRGQQGYGMSTSKGSVSTTRVVPTNTETRKGISGGRGMAYTEIIAIAKGYGKQAEKNAKALAESVTKNKSSGVKKKVGKDEKGYNQDGDYNYRYGKGK